VRMNTVAVRRTGEQQRRAGLRWHYRAGRRSNATRAGPPTQRGRTRHAHACPTTAPWPTARLRDVPRLSLSPSPMLHRLTLLYILLFSSVTCIPHHIVLRLALNATTLLTIAVCSVHLLSCCGAYAYHAALWRTHTMATPLPFPVLTPALLRGSAERTVLRLRARGGVSLLYALCRNARSSAHDLLFSAVRREPHAQRFCSAAN